MGKILKVYNSKEPILRNKCRQIERMEAWVLELANDMWMTMLMGKAIGLAANQVGFDYRLIVVRGDMFEGPMINPVIEEKSEEIFHFAEGCLSVPGYGFDTGKRSKAIKVKFNDLEGKPQTLWLKDKTAVIVQHEIDHLDGILFVDYMDGRLR